MQSATDRTRQLVRGLIDARRNSMLFEELAELQRDQSKAEIFRRISRNESAMADHWSGQIRSGANSVGRRWSFSYAVYRWSARLLPSRIVGRSLRERHKRWLSANSHLLGDSTVQTASADTVDALNRLSADSHSQDGHPEQGWLASQSGALRAAVLGMNDGLVSNFSLTMGIAGATDDATIVLIAGLAGLLAGALSMAAGEYVSVKSQSEFYANLVSWERVEIALWHEEESNELAALFVAKGLKPEEAKIVADRLMSDPEVALDTHVREELGIDPDTLGGSPWSAAASSLLAFAGGAIVPIIPYVFGFVETTAIAMSAIGSLIALVAVGYWLGWIARTNAIVSGIRMAFIGAGAAAITFLLGTAVGTQLAG